MSTIKNACLLAFMSAMITTVKSQDLPAVHRNGSNSRHQAMMNSDSWTFGINTSGSFGLESNDNTLFRGNSIATKLLARYYFGNIGLGFTSGITPGAISGNALTKFMTERKFPQDQLQISKSNPSNNYLLFGPSFRFGSKVFVNTEIQGGLFFNNPGAVNIAKPGDTRSLYRFDGGDNNIFPGFSGSISINYPINGTTYFFINTDYLQSKSSIRLLDPQRGIDIASQVNRDVKLFTAGFGILKSFGGRRASSGSTVMGGRNNDDAMFSGNTPASSSIIHSGLPTGKRLRPGRSKFSNITRQNNENCGPVTFINTNPDGTTEQKTFACPADAAQYSQSSNMAANAVKPIQQKEFGNNVNSGMNSSVKGIISGSIKWLNENSFGIETNETEAVSSVGSLSGSGGGAAAASYARMMSNPENQQGVVTTIYAREAVHGKATEKGPYQPVYDESNPSLCVDCVVNAKLKGHEETHVAQQSNGLKTSNPLYQGNGSQGTNPMYESKGMSGKEGGLCGTTGHFFVILSDAGNGTIVAKTKPDSCGNFWFSNVPAGNYIIRVKGQVLVKKVYDVTINKTGKYDLAGEMLLGENQLAVQLLATTEDGESQKNKVIVRGWDSQKKASIADSDNKNNAKVGMSGRGVSSGGTIGSTAHVAGEPIGGIVVKGGRNPGGSLRTTQTNENGAFEFNSLEKGSYTFSTELPYNFDEETLITIGEPAIQNIASGEQEMEGGAARKGWDGTVKGGSKADNNQTQQKVQNTVMEEQNMEGAARKGWDGTVKGGSKADNNQTQKEVQKAVKGETNMEGDAARKGWDGTVKGGSKIEKKSAAGKIEK